MEKIRRGFLLPSAAFMLARKQLRFCRYTEKPPEVGDVVYGVVRRIGEHSSLENKSGRIHIIQNGTRSVFVFGNRYAPAYFEGEVPTEMCSEMDLLSRSGIVGVVKSKNSLKKDPTRVEVLGYICDEVGKTLNTKQFPLVKPKHTEKRYPRSKMILICGTSMDSGKSMAASACCWALSSMGKKVRAPVARLREILLGERQR